MRRPSGARGSSCRPRAAPTGSSNAACPSRTQDAAACPARAGAAAPRTRPATWAAGPPPSAAPVQERGTDRSFTARAKEELFEIADHVGALGRRETEEPRIEPRVALKRREPEHRGLPQAVDKLHDFEAGRPEAHADSLEAAFLVARQRLEPLTAVLRAPVREHERPHGLVVPCEQRCRRGAERLVELFHRDLLQVLVVDPYFGAVADDELGVWLDVVPSEFSRPRERERPARFLQQLAVAVEDFLLEFSARGKGLVDELREALEARRSDDRGHERKKR